MTVTSPVEPTCYTEAAKHPSWRQAMSEEFQALMNQGTWSLVPRPSNRRVIGCRWVYKLKEHSDGTVARYKARLVAKGYHQVEGVDFNETFSPVVKQPTIKIVLSIALHYNWPIRQLDISNAFLHGTLEENIFMEQPIGFKDTQFPTYVCKLRKALYGLKQSPRAWYSLLSKFLIHKGFVNSVSDTSLFTCHTPSYTLIVLIYVDDIIITGSSDHAISDFILSMSKEFNTKDLGSLHYFLGIEVTPSQQGMILSQSKYALELLKRAGMTDCKPVASPCALKPPKESDPDSPCTDVSEYRRLVGSLQYLTITRPDITFAVNVVCQHMHNPMNSHLSAVRRIIRYIKGTLSHGLHLKRGPLNLIAYSDADWAGDSSDRKSTSGYCVFLGPNLITWSAKKQKTIARSSTEAEYRALADAAAELIWDVKILTDLRIRLAHTPLLWCDNISAISLASNPVFHARMKHIEIDYHFVRHFVINKHIQVRFVSTLDQVADIFTKPLSSPRHKYLQDKLNVHHMPINLREGIGT